MLVDQFSNVLDLNKIADMYRKCGNYATGRYLCKNGVPLYVAIAILNLAALNPKKAG